MGDPRLRFITSPVLRAWHGFSTRAGGVSTGRYATLNLGERWGDAPENVEQNRRLLAEAGGWDRARLATVRQVHGARVVCADGRSADELRAEEADALWTSEPGRTVGIYSADCVSILLDDGAGRVAAAHAGWRGTVAGVARAAVEALCAAGAERGKLRAALGPSICRKCFEVGEEVALKFEHLEGAVVRAPGRKPHVDLHAANALQLHEAGIPLDQIDAAPPCSMCDGARFFSFRRDGARIGQMLSWVVAG